MQRFWDKEFYAGLGLKVGLEVHRQLDTSHKLFCKCPVLPYSKKFHSKILRHMRPTLSELGLYDPAALMEFKTKKEIVYCLNRDTVCTYEMDDAPPFEMNREALEKALVIGTMLNLNLVDELHIARKQLLDGSIPTGFQRTTLLGICGHIMVNGRKIDILHLGLEEDSAREVSDRGHRRTYMTDRLSIPQVEIVTAPLMETPQEAAEVGQAIRRLCHLSKMCRTGLGRARQDVNVSIDGGTRIEIKGVGSLRDVPKLVHYEALRQKALIELKDTAISRGIDDSSFGWSGDVTELVKQQACFGFVWGPKSVAQAILLKNCQGILATPTGPGRVFAHELSDRIRVVACLDTLPNLVCSDNPEYFDLGPMFDEIRTMAGGKAGDAVVIVLGPEADVVSADLEIKARMVEMLKGVPKETRRPIPGGATRFERVLPGRDRMYPDTDLPPIVLTGEAFDLAKAKAPASLWDKEAEYRELGLSKNQLERLFTQGVWELFDHLVEKVALKPTILAYLLLDWMPYLKRQQVLVPEADIFIELFAKEKDWAQKEAAAALAFAVGHEVHWKRKGRGNE